MPIEIVLGIFLPLVIIVGGGGAGLFLWCLISFLEEFIRDSKI